MQQTSSHFTKTLSKLPACSGIALEIIRYSLNGELDKSSFFKLVSSDPILTIQILKTANATVFNYPQKISSLEKALVILGFDMVRDIALSLSVMSLLQGQTHQKYIHQICHHSLITAFSLKILAQNYDSDHKELLYLGGLLHDIGKILLLNRLGEEYCYLLEKYKQENKSLMELEIKFLGYDHAEAGADLAEQWNLPPGVVSMIRFHHNPEQENSGYKQAFRNQLVYLGNIIARRLEENFENPNFFEESDPDLQKNLAISSKEYTHILDETRKEIKSQKLILNHLLK